MTSVPINPTEIGARIKNIRTKQGKTQAYYADLLYISPSYLALIESGKRFPSIEVMIQIAKIGNVSIDYLIFGESKEQDTAIDYVQMMFQRLRNAYPANKIEKALRLAEYYLLLERETPSLSNSDKKKS